MRALFGRNESNVDMVAVQQDPLKMTEAEYLEFEEKSEIKHEFVNGKVYVMSGGSIRHGAITVNTSTTLNVQLANRDCTVCSPDTRIKSDAMTSYRYPDVTVFCGEPQYVDGRIDTIRNLIALLEVLSPSTAIQDRNEKLDEYIQIPTLQDYVQISQHEAKVEVYTRERAGKWIYTQHRGLDASVELASIGCTLALSKLYEKVSFDQAG